MSKVRLKANHGTYKKYQKLYDLATKLGISFTFEGGQCILTDENYPDKKFHIEDIEDGQMVFGFPHETEIKITTDA